MNNESLPRHMPIDMAFAPNPKPYHHKVIIHKEEIDNKVSQHSLSPEKLGIVGYVKDVAGFMKDVVNQRREKKQLERRRNSTNSVQTNTEVVVAEEQPVVRRNSDTTNNKSKPFIDAITGLFPAINQNKTNEHCTHTEELRNQMLQVNEKQHALTHKYKF